MAKRLFNLAALLLLCTLCLMLSGCSFKFTQVGDLIRPPVYSYENEELRKAFKSDFSSEAVYKSPISGEYLSAFLSYNLDDDGEKESLVFYADDAYDTTVSIALYDIKDGKWTLSTSIEGDGCDVFSVEFIDFDGDSVQEIVVCWSLFNSKSNKIVSVYSADKSTLEIKKMSSELYTMKSFSDIDFDGDSELFLILLDFADGKQESAAKLLGMDDNGFTVLDKKWLDGSVSGYKEIVTERNEQAKTTTFLVDAYKGEAQMITEVIIWDNDTRAMSVPLLDSETFTNTQSWRGIRLFCSDINADGKKEIPFREPFENAEIPEDGSETTIYTTSWFNVRNGRPEIVAKTLLNYEEQCLFKIPQEWENEFSVTMYEKKWDFYQINSYTGAKKEYLFSVVFLTEEEWRSDSSAQYESYELLKTQDKKCVAVTGINTENELNVSFDMLSQAFSYFSQ